MNRVKWTDKQMVDADELNALGTTPEAYLASMMEAIFDDVIFDGLTVGEDTPVSADVVLATGSAVCSGEFLQISVAQDVHILSGSDGVNGWGNGQAADGSNPRYTIVVVKDDSAEGTPATMTFLNDAVSPPVPYQSSVNTRVSNTYDIDVVHGTAAGSPTVPATPAGWIKVATILVGTGVTSISDASITQNSAARYSGASGSSSTGEAEAKAAVTEARAMDALFASTFFEAAFDAFVNEDNIDSGNTDVLIDDVTNFRAEMDLAEVGGGGGSQYLRSVTHTAAVNITHCLLVGDFDLNSQTLTPHVSNDGGSSWEAANFNEVHEFSSTGLSLIVRFTFTSTNNTETPYLHWYGCLWGLSVH